MTYNSINLEQLREQNPTQLEKSPFSHQSEAFEALGKVFNFRGDTAKSGLLVLPTGAGKTFTAVKWLCTNVLPKNIKILWLAQSFHLLDQAFSEFNTNARWIPEPRNSLNIRVISSALSHDRPSSIQLTDDVVIMTTQTAIKNLYTEALDNRGRTVTTNFKKFIENCKQSRLFVVLDEAHHAPAYGCRNLLVSKQEATPGIRELLPNLYLLGLTATPTYNDETRRGWLGKIFEQGVIYEAKKAKLMAQNILARPNYIEKATGQELEVNDELYTQLAIEHKDIPEWLVEKLAKDHPRNDLIINEYVQNKEQYGKTIIFADRWFQCVYLRSKLLEKGIKAKAIYSHIDADPGTAEARNQRNSTENAAILKEFKEGKDASGNDKLDVLINVRMLTEGTDVPSVKTVFITRQTTSPILLTQMIGRALRGKRAGGNSEANIVLFVDKWKRLIEWATPTLTGGIEDGKPVTRGFYPLEYISIGLIEELSRQINSGEYSLLPFSQTLPIGWFQTEITVSTSEEQFDEMQSFSEFIMVYEHTKPEFDTFIAAISKKLPDVWAKEYLSPEEMQPQVNQWIETYFDRENDGVESVLESDLIKIARHIAQKQNAPIYYPFEDRDKYDLDELARKLVEMSVRAIDENLRNEFSTPGSLWKAFYKSYNKFKTAFDGAMNRVLHEQQFGITSTMLPELTSPMFRRLDRGLTPNELTQLFNRDGNACLACGAEKGRGVKLQADHIVPYAMGGETTVANLQTLCSICNSEKKIHEINFRFNHTQLASPKKLDLMNRYIKRNGEEEEVNYSLTRVINFFFHCKAVYKITRHIRSSGKYYSTWQVELYAGNNPQWLLKHKAALIQHIQTEFNCPQVKDIIITSP